MLGFGPLSSAPMGAIAEIKFPANSPELLIQISYVEIGSKTSEGEIVSACDLPWRIIAGFLKDGDEYVRLLANSPRKLEELIAAAYAKDGFDVVLTPRSGDGGKDIVATKKGHFQLRIIDQVKAYSPGTLVTHDDVRNMIGVLALDQGANKGIITTTSRFQPQVKTSPEFVRLMPTRLQLRERSDLIELFANLETVK
jgi:restriction system protein